jgi:hypothetical protein
MQMLAVTDNAATAIRDITAQEAVPPGAGLRIAADRIAAELKHQYRLGWDPSQGPSRFRRVVVVATRKGVTVRTRSGYVPPS